MFDNFANQAVSIFPRLCNTRIREAISAFSLAITSCTAGSASLFPYVFKRDCTIATAPESSWRDPQFSSRSVINARNDGTILQPYDVNSLASASTYSSCNFTSLSKSFFTTTCAVFFTQSTKLFCKSFSSFSAFSCACVSTTHAFFSASATIPSAF